MPQVGERKSKGGVTGEWNGSTWVQVDNAPSTDAQDPAVMRFLGGAAKTSPLNPMNLGHAVMHPLDTLWNAVATPVDEARRAVKSGIDTVTGNGENGRAISAAEMFKHLGGAVPLVGKPLMDAGDKLGNGDLAGGAGELAGIASGALLPKVPGALADSMEAVGRGAEALGKSKTLARAQALAPIEAVTGHPIAAAASLAAPPLLRGGGRLAQRGGAALNGLLEATGKAPEAEVAAAAGDPAVRSTEVPYNWGWHKMAGEEVPVEPNAFTGSSKVPAASRNSDVPFTHEGFVNDMKQSVAPPNGGLTETPAFKGLQDAVRRSNLSPIQKFLEDDPQAALGGEGRMTGQFEEGSGGLSDVAAGNITRHPVPALSPLDELSQMSGRALTPEQAQALLDRFQGFGVR